MTGGALNKFDLALYSHSGLPIGKIVQKKNMYVYVYLYIIEYLILLPDTFVETIVISNESNKNTSMS